MDRSFAQLAAKLFATILDNDLFTLYLAIIVVWLEFFWHWQLAALRLEFRVPAVYLTSAFREVFGRQK